MEQITCLLCNSSEYKPIITGRDYLLGLPGEFTVVECQKCGLRFTNPRPSEGELAYYYSEDYGPHKAQLLDSNSRDESLSKKFMTGLKQSPFGRFLKKIINSTIDSKAIFIPNLPEGIKVLELGCAVGYFLDSLRKKGWDLYGVEPTKSAATYAREALGLNIFCGTLQEANFPSGYFDAIFAWHVVEHLSNPLQTLREVNRVLKKDGYFAFSIPNAGCWEFYVFKDRWYGLEVPRHLFHFTIHSIKKILEATGFRIERVFYQRNITNIVGSLVYWLRDLVGKNRLRTILRDFPFFLLLPLAIFLSAIKQAGRMTIVARLNKI